MDKFCEILGDCVDYLAIILVGITIGFFLFSLAYHLIAALGWIIVPVVAIVAAFWRVIDLYTKDRY
jgi:hypothetical protein